MISGNIERKVIGPILIDPDYFFTLASELGLMIGHFQDEGNRTIYRAISEVTARGQTADIVVVKNWLCRTGDIEFVPDGVKGLSKIIDEIDSDKSFRLFRKNVARLTGKASPAKRPAARK